MSSNRPPDRFASEDPGSHVFEDGFHNEKSETPVSEKPEVSALPPTDEGVTPWVCVAGGFCLMFVSFGWITCIGVFQDYYQTHQLRQYSPSTVAWIPSLETCVMFLWGPVVGKLFDNYGPRWLLVVGTILHVLGLMMLSLCTQYYQFILAQSICSATGASFLFFSGITAVSTWFVRRRALALGITVSGSGLGGVIFPVMVERLNDRLGFPWTIRVCAFLILGLCVFANATVRSRIRHVPKPVRLADYWMPLKEVPFSTFTVGYFIFYLGFFVPYNFIVLEAERYGVSPTLAPYMVPIMNAGGIVGRIAPGWLADRLGRFNVMILTTTFSSILTLALWLPGTSQPPILAFSILYGFSSGAFVTLAPAILAQISPLPQLGARQGICFAFIAVAALVGNPIAGALVPDTRVDGFWKLQLFAGMMMVGGTVGMVGARGAVAGWRVGRVV